jgi:hypothetical protein
MFIITVGHCLSCFQWLGVGCVRCVGELSSRHWVVTLNYLSYVIDILYCVILFSPPPPLLLLLLLLLLPGSAPTVSVGSVWRLPVLKECP